MFQLLDIAKGFLNQAKIEPDGILVDFTMGNGHDTLYLCSLVPCGTVYAFDIQEQALINTKTRLDEAGVTSDVVLIKDSHSNAKEYINGEINGGMFNLGYRPGGDKNVHTMHESTLCAVKDAVNMLKKGGVLVISVYPGHEEGKIEGEKVYILKPHTYMNLSGNSVIKTANFYKILPQNIIVIHDDMDLPVGKIKAKLGGGAGGHNGLKSIDAAITPNYNRIRIGVGHPDNKGEAVINHVLSKFSKTDEKRVFENINAVVETIGILIKKGMAEYSNQIGMLQHK